MKMKSEYKIGGRCMKRVSTQIAMGCIILLLASLVFGCKDEFGFRKGDGFKKKIKIVKKIDDHDIEICCEGDEECFFRGKEHFKKGGFPGKKHYKKGVEFYLKCEEKLDLSESQVKELKKIRDDFKKIAIEKKAEIEVLNVDFKRMVDGDDFDLMEIKKMIGKISDIKEELMYMKFEVAAKAKKILTEEQREKIKSWKKDYHKKKDYHGCSKDD